MGKEFTAEIEKFLKGDLSIRELLSIDDIELEYLQQIGYIFFREGRLREAEIIFRGILKIAPEEPYVYFALGGIYFSMGKIDSARKFFEKGISMDPENVEGLLNLGEILLELGERKKAYGYLMRCKELVKRDNYPVYTRVRLLLSTFFEK